MFYDLSGCSDPSSLLLTRPPSSLSPTTALLTGHTRSPSGDWVRLAPHTQALIAAAPYVHIPFITRALLPEWNYRISSLQDAGLIFSYFLTSDGPCPLPLRPSDILRHLGASFHCTFLSNLAFDTQIRHIRHTFLSQPLSPTPKEPCP